jgi:hypothetical protein
MKEEERKKKRCNNSSIPASDMLKFFRWEASETKKDKSQKESENNEGPFMNTELVSFAPTSSADFDRAYRAPITIRGDFRIAPELKELAKEGAPQRSLESGCGAGRLSLYAAQGRMFQ